MDHGTGGIAPERLVKARPWPPSDSGHAAEALADPLVPRTFCDRFALLRLARTMGQGEGRDGGQTRVLAKQSWNLCKNFFERARLSSRRVIVRPVDWKRNGGDSANFGSVVRGFRATWPPRSTLWARSSRASKPIC
ncbi:hypothetical protein TARUN_5909 [Trichoderma arundinaceum]|uniref:Uncharacterized protein n=1 Tax=Trichoderma arundinaceum TaxID=490622 RepID=A0A395NJQ6_TRIAR|nr:hypothetical protein TARUN_5909 [Trichoderma arundinaceum]